jgi:polyhydroxyalkanoate synthesis repressor PhaR
VIRKYGNRRLYRTDESRYVTLTELTHLVHADVSFTVVDAKSGQDITSTILAQVILEQERAQEDVVYPAHLLRRLIRMNDESLARFANEHLPRLLDLHEAAEGKATELLDQAIMNPGQGASPKVMSELRSIQGRLDTLLTALEPISES